MLTVEDLLERLERFLWYTPKGKKFDFPAWDRRFIADVASFTREGKRLSDDQSNLAIKLIKSYENMLRADGVDSSALSALIASPLHRNQPYISPKIKREIRYMGENKVLMRFKYNPVIIEKLREAKYTNPYTRKSYPHFDSALKIWIVEINDISYEKIVSIVRLYRFDFDDEVAEFFMNFENAKSNQSEVLLEDEIVVHCHDGFTTEWVNFLASTEMVDV